jgi:hypothetical protein
MSAERPAKSPPKVSEAEIVTKIKDSILTQWQKLPVSEQRETALDLLDEVMSSQYMSEFREAIDTRWPVKQKSLHATFALVSLDHDDLRRAHLDEAELAQLSDDDLVDIARGVRNHFVQDAFWDEVEYVARAMLEHREGSENADNTAAASHC